MAAEVEFVTPAGVQHALYEKFPIGGSYDDKPAVWCLAIQNEAGGRAVRVKKDSAEHKALVKRHPELGQLDEPHDEEDA